MDQVSVREGFAEDNFGGWTAKITLLQHRDAWDRLHYEVSGSPQHVFLTWIMPSNKNAFLRYQVIDELLSQKTYSRKQLLSRLTLELGYAVSESTLDKDIRFLRDHFRAPIESSRTGYKYSDPSFTLSNFKLTRSEERALEFTIAMLDKNRSSEIVQEGQTILNKIFRRFNSERNGAKIIASDLSLNIRGVEWLLDLYNAIKERRSITIKYYSFRQKKVDSHIFSPYLLKEYLGMWYVVGYSARKNFTIVMALDRIKSVGIANTNFHMDPDFDSDKYFRFSLGITHRIGQEPKKVEFWVEKSAYYYLTVKPLHSSQKMLEETKDGFIVQLEVFLSEELLISLMSLGSRVKVLKPAELVADIRNHIDKLKNYYA